MIINEDNRKTVTLQQLCADICGKHGNNDLRLNEEGVLQPHTGISNPLHSKAFRDAKRNGAMDVVEEAVKRELGPVPAKMIMANYRQKGHVTPNDLAAIQQSVKLAMPACIAQAQQSYEKQRSTPVAKAQELPTPANLLADGNEAKWVVSESGAGGALIALPNGPGSIPGIVKIETPHESKTASEMANVMDEVLNQTPDEAPFEVVKTSSLQPSAQLKQQLNSKIDQAAPHAGSAARKAISSHREVLNAPDLKGKSLTLMGFANGKQLNELPVAEKIALMKSAQFAQDVGKASVVCPMFGLNDHFGPNKVVIEGRNEDQKAEVAELYGSAEKANEMRGLNFGTGTKNPSNFMLNADNGRLIAIDYNTPPLLSGPGYGVSNAKDAVLSIQGLVDAYEANPKVAVDRLTADGLNQGTKTPLSGTAARFLSSDKDGDSFFKPHELPALMEHVSPEELEAFSENLLKGASQGLQYVKKHAEKFEVAYTKSALRNNQDPTQQRNFMDKNDLESLKGGIKQQVESPRVGGPSRRSTGDSLRVHEKRNIPLPKPDEIAASLASLNQSSSSNQVPEVKLEKKKEPISVEPQALNPPSAMDARIAQFGAKATTAEKGNLVKKDSKKDLLVSPAQKEAPSVIRTKPIG